MSLKVGSAIKVMKPFDPSSSDVVAVVLSLDDSQDTRLAQDCRCMTLTGRLHTMLLLLDEQDTEGLCQDFAKTRGGISYKRDRQ